MGFTIGPHPTTSPHPPLLSSARARVCYTIPPRPTPTHHPPLPGVSGRRHPVRVRKYDTIPPHLCQLTMWSKCESPKFPKEAPGIQTLGCDLVLRSRFGKSGPWCVHVIQIVHLITKNGLWVYTCDPNPCARMIALPHTHTGFAIFLWHSFNGVYQNSGLGLDQHWFFCAK